jgi:hypothetical protein
VARTGGLIATALLGAILAASGPSLTAGFRFALLTCALAAAAGAVSGFVLIRNPPARAATPGGTAPASR